MKWEKKQLQHRKKNKHNKAMISYLPVLHKHAHPKNIGQFG